MRSFDSCLNLFINDLKDSEHLSHDRTLALILLYKESGDIKFLNDVLLGNIWFIISRAKRYNNRYLTASDLIYSGMLGMARAAKKFDPSRNIKFITYASYWIEMYMRREVIYNSSVVKITPRTWKMSSLLFKMRNSGISEEAIMKELKIGKNTLRRFRSSHIDMSLNSAVDEGSDNQELGKILLVDYETPADICSENDLSDYLLSAVNKLKIREQEIILRKFGLKNYKKENLKEISSYQDISPERVRQLLKSGLRKLKNSIARKETA
ncbi:MAG: sigma-70 family RNA polymerase sigma factor [Lentisphaerota bacterium]